MPLRSISAPNSRTVDEAHQPVGEAHPPVVEVRNADPEVRNTGGDVRNAGLELALMPLTPSSDTQSIPK